MKRVPAIIVLAFLLAPRFASAAPQVVTLDDAVFSMRMCATRLREVPEKEKAFKTPQPCDKAAKTASVKNSAGETISLDNSWILSDIETIRSAFKEKRVPCRMERRSKRNKKKNSDDEDSEREAIHPWDVCGDSFAEFKTLRQALTNLADTVEHSAESAKEIPVAESQLAADKASVKKILAKDEYRSKKKEVEKKDDGKESEWYKNLKRWLKKHLPHSNPKPRVPTTHFGPGVSPEAVMDILRAAVAVALILVIAFLAVMLALRFKRLLADEASEDEGEGEAAEPSANVKAMLSEAEILRRKGEFRLAIRSLFLAFLRLLEQKELVEFIKNKTNREYLRELKKKKQVGPEIEQMNILFEESWYGMKDCGEKEYAEFLAIYEESKREV